MEKKKIAWVDDDIQSSLLSPYIDEFYDYNVEIVRIKSVKGLLETLEKEALSLSAILIDTIMPPENLDFGKTRGGLRTGLFIIEQLLNDDTLKNIPIVCVTNVDDIKVSDFCSQNSIPCLKKGDYFSNTFVEAILEIIESNHNNKAGK